MNLVKFNPQTGNVRMRGIDPFDHFMNSFLKTSTINTDSEPTVNLIESDDDFFIEMAAPGYSKEDFKIEIENQLLTISVSKEEKEESLKKLNYLRSEFNFGNFSRSFRIGKSLDTDKIEASYENGILRLKLQKKEEAKQKPPRNIQVN
ncbi:MAG: Hsp20/alpha crystallin family protein [Bacteroidota bacterium]|nr:Hsp20/alpha crystallin family protein [Bacteroidota bacterium]